MSPERPGVWPGRLSGADKPKQPRRQQRRAGARRKPSRVDMGEIGSKTTDHDGIIVREECAKRKRKRFLSGAMRGVYEGKSLSSSGESQSSSGPGGQIRQVIKGRSETRTASLQEGICSKLPHNDGRRRREDLAPPGEFAENIKIGV